MKKSINAWTFPPSYTFSDVLKSAKKAGFDAVEFNLDAVGVTSKHAFTLESEDSLIASVASEAKELGIEIVSISSSLHGSIWSNPSDEEYRMTVLKKQLQIAKICGSDTILIVPGGMKNGMLLNVARQNAIAALKSAIPVIEHYGVTVGVENVWNGFFLSPYDMVSFLRELDHPLFGIYFDLGNMVAFSDSASWADIVAPYIAKMHIKDFKRAGGINRGGNFCQLLEGDLDFDKSMSVLKKHGFDGYLTAEVSKGSLEISDEEYFKSIADAEDVIIGYYNKA